MSFRPGRQPTNLSIHPPSPFPGNQPTISTPTNLHPSNPLISSPRRAPLTPSPTYSTTSSAPWLEDRARNGSLDVHRGEHAPPLPSKSDKRLPSIPGQSGQIPNSPHRHGKGVHVGAYDNKLVSSTLSQLPPLPPLSPTPTGTTNLSHSSSQLNISRNPSAPLSRIPTSSTNTSSATAVSGRPSFSHPSSSSGVVVLPNGTALPTSSNDAHDRPDRSDGGIGLGRSIIETMAHSSPSSPWSLLTVHVLPLFAGAPLKTPIEDLNQLCHSHIIATSQRAQPSRIVALLSSDFREFVASGMLTLKSKFETLDEPKIIGRAAEVWSFFWGQVLPYLEAVFLPFTQVRDLPSTSQSSSISSYASLHPIPVRHILLSGFLLHILLPLVQRLIPLVSNTSPNVIPPNTNDLQRILQMSLVLSTQARFSSFLPGHERRDEEIRLNVEDLGKTVRWRMQRALEGVPSPAKRPDSLANRMSLQRASSINNGRYRRKGWRASSHFGQSWGMPLESSSTSQPMIGRQQSDNMAQMPESKWGRPRVDDEDEDDVTPGQSFAYPKNTVRDEGYSAVSTAPSTIGASTFTTTASTLRGGSVGTAFDGSQRTPQAENLARRPMRADSNGSSDLTPVPTVRR